MRRCDYDYTNATYDDHDYAPESLLGGYVHGGRSVGTYSFEFEICTGLLTSSLQNSQPR